MKVLITFADVRRVTNNIFAPNVTKYLMYTSTSSNTTDTISTMKRLLQRWLACSRQERRERKRRRERTTQLKMDATLGSRTTRMILNFLRRSINAWTTTDHSRNLLQGTASRAFTQISSNCQLSRGRRNARSAATLGGHCRQVKFAVIFYEGLECKF